MRALRNFKPNRCYHLNSRIANRAFYLTDEEACAFLEGKRPQDLEEVESRMREAAEKVDYEHAARLRDTVFALKEMTKAHFIRKSPHMREENAARGLEELAAVAGVNVTTAAEVRRVASSAASERT